MLTRTRRDFLVQSSLALGGAASATHLLSQTSAHPVAPLRGLMVDAARVPEPLAWYRRVIDFCAEWRLNALHFRLADDQGCALRFSSVPDLYLHRHAFTPAELHNLALYAHTRGVDLLPELESFGHTGYITRSSAYAHLLDADAQQSEEFTGIIPVHPETLQLFNKLYRELAEIFPSIYLHGGCDEVNWGGSALSHKALQAKQRYQIWAEYLNSLDHIAQSLGKQFIVWGDMVVHKEPRILEHLNKSIIVMDWDYAETSSAKLATTRAKIRAAGCRAIGAPALISYRVGPRAGLNQLANINAFADAYLNPKENANDPGTLGVILTNWVPTRYIQNSIWDGFAYASAAFNEGASTAQKSAFQRFVDRHYGATWSYEWDEAFQLIYKLAPQIREQDTPDGAFPLRVPWSSDQELSALPRSSKMSENPYIQLCTLLDRLEKEVSKNLPDFKALSLSAKYLQHTFWRDQILTGPPLTREEAAALIKTIADRDRTLASALSKDWDQSRFPDSPAKSAPLFGFEPKDQLLFQFQRAANYSASLASHPARFHQLIAAAKHV